MLYPSLSNLLMHCHPVTRASNGYYMWPKPDTTCYQRQIHVNKKIIKKEQYTSIHSINTISYYWNLVIKKDWQAFRNCDHFNKHYANIFHCSGNLPGEMPYSRHWTTCRQKLAKVGCRKSAAQRCHKKIKTFILLKWQLFHTQYFSKLNII